MRKKPPGALLSKTAHAVEREYRIINALGEKSDVPVPKVYTLCEDVSVIGTPFYVMEFLQGRIFSDIRLLEIPFEERRQWYKYSLCNQLPCTHLFLIIRSWLSAVSTLGKLHSVDYRAIGLEGYGRDSGFYTRQMKSLRNVTDAQAAVKNKDTGDIVGAIPRLDELYQWFEKNQVQDKATIVHGDYKIDNLVTLDA